MGRPIHYCEDREDPYFKYIPPTTTSTTTTIDPSINPSNFISYNVKNACLNTSGCLYPTSRYLDIDFENSCCYISFTPDFNNCTRGVILQFQECNRSSQEFWLIDNQTTFYVSSGQVNVYSGDILDYNLISCGAATTTTTPCPVEPVPLCPPGYTLVTSINELGCTTYECVSVTTTPCPCPREINPSCFHVAYRDESPCQFAPASNPFYHHWTNLPLEETAYTIYIDVFLRYERVQVFYRDPITTNFVDLYDLDNVTHEWNSPLSEAPCCEDFGSSMLTDSFTKPSGVDALIIAISNTDISISAVVVGICPLGEQIFIDACATTTSTTTSTTTTIPPSGAYFFNIEPKWVRPIL